MSRSIFISSFIALLAGIPIAHTLAAPPVPQQAPPATTTSTEKTGPPAQSPLPALKQRVALLGADEKDTLSMAVPVKVAVTNHDNGELRVSTFSSQDLQPILATGRIRTDEKGGSEEMAPTASVRLDNPHTIRIWLSLDRLPAAKVMKGKLFLVAGDSVQQWDLNLTTGGRGTLAVTPIGTLKLVTPWPWSRSCLDHAFSFTVYDKSDLGPYHHLTARLEPSGNAASKALSSTFGLDNFSFFQKTGIRSAAASCLGNGYQPVDLEQRTQVDSSDDAARTVNQARAYTAVVNGLSPGEYSGTLLFMASETADDARLPVTIQVRHHWIVAVLVILFGSAVGWFSSKYVVAKRKARDLMRQLSVLRARADFLAKPTFRRAGWQFASEAGSLGLARVRVTLHQLSTLAESALPLIVREQEIQQMRQDVEVRLSALESLREARLSVEAIAEGRPAAQLAIGCLLRRATGVLEGPTFGDPEKAQLDGVLKLIAAWADGATFIAMYRQAVLDRRRGNECPITADVLALEAGPIRQQLEILIAALPTEASIAAQTDAASLRQSDHNIARLALLWREADQPWAADLAAAYAGGESLYELFHTVDAYLWNALQCSAAQLSIERDPTRNEHPQTYETMEIYLQDHILGITRSRIQHHPLRVGWSIEPPDSNAARVMETDGLTVVQYFSSSGSVRLTASLRWEGKDIQVPRPLSFHIIDNPDYRGRRMFTEWTEYGAIGIAVVFSIATALATLYDSTFGTLAQYFTLFIWSAGAGTGGNLFTQLGTTWTAGGRADASLPTAGRT
jgi:hypothetical protein